MVMRARSYPHLATWLWGGSLIVGCVIFLILVTIQFIVITKGATRISEVNARFTLDALPGKQMAIDAELNVGAIDEKQAQQRRQELAAEAEFYGAMDGASKYVRGDAIAGLVIMVVNIVGGVLLAVTNGVALAEAMQIYAIFDDWRWLGFTDSCVDHRDQRRCAGYQVIIRIQSGRRNQHSIQKWPPCDVYRCDHFCWSFRLSVVCP